MGEECSTDGVNEERISNFGWETSKEKNTCGDLVLDGRIILKQIFDK
jgi:hypothetical protein